tara:strand:- start:9707 stop:10246 length:540 start_codon:yes stop_codon:yes gene_type:complete
MTTNNSVRVAVVMGSDSDLPQLEGCIDTLKNLGIPFDVRVLSAHRTPDSTAEFAKNSEGIYSLFIAAAGGAAHLAGAIAANTTLPVIGVPLSCPPFNGMDSLFATVQMPPGVPVATVSAGKWGGINAAILACQILSISNPRFGKTMEDYKVTLARRAFDKDARLQEKINKSPALTSAVA